MASSFETFGIREMRFRQLDGVVDPTTDLPNGNGVYGYGKKRYDRPELLAPPQEESGGFLFLPGEVGPELIDQLVALAGLASTENRRQDRYGVQVIDAPEGMEGELGYMRKIVIADRFALLFLFRGITEGEYDTMPQQSLDVAELVKLFVEDERNKYGTGFGSPGLAGKFGGDGYFAQEALGFGFAIENKYHRVISIWSRAWLCTK